MKPVILIPSYNPDQRLLDTLQLLGEHGYTRIVVVDDGSKSECLPIFQAVTDLPGVHLLRHAVNMGKGRAMKTGFNAILARFSGSSCIVCDADGQHPVESINDVADAMEKHADALVLGVRRFSENKDMPRANYLGNQITRFMFRIISGMSYMDTQCGLRGYPASVMAKIMNIPGERFEYENTMLLAARRLNLPIVQVGMPAVYQKEGEYSSHFNKVRDSVRIYKMLLAHALPALIAAGFGFLAFMWMLYLMPAGTHPGMYWGCFPVAALISYALSWLIQWISLCNKKKWLLPSLGMAILSFLLYGLVLLLLPTHPVYAWFIAAIPEAVINYAVYLRLRDGKLPPNLIVK